MANGSEREQLRQEIKRARRNATNKLSRLKSKHDVYGSGSRIDPRRKPNVEKNYTTRQMRSYLGELQGFTSRSTQYVGGADNRPIPISEWRKFKRAEAKYIKAVDKHFSQYADLALPTSTETVGERMAAVTPTHRRVSSVDAPYKPKPREPRNIKSVAKLRELTKEMERRANPKHFERLLRQAKKQNRQMLDPINDRALAKAVRKLTAKQFELLWNYTPYATSISIVYEDYKRRTAGRAEERWEAGVKQTSRSKAMEYVEWAGEQ